MILVHFTGPERNITVTSNISKQQIKASKSKVSKGPNASRTHHRTQNKTSCRERKTKKTPQLTITNDQYQTKPNSHRSRPHTKNNILRKPHEEKQPTQESKKPYQQNQKFQYPRKHQI